MVRVKRQNKTSASISESNVESVDQSSGTKKHKNHNPSPTTVPFITIADDKTTEIKYIYHISDIHIRTTKRHQEYAEVFERLYKQLQKSINDRDKKSQSAIVITGDIMHGKTELSPEAIHIARKLFVNLSAIAPLFLIIGNHDCNLSNKKRMDALSPIIDAVSTVEPNKSRQPKSSQKDYQTSIILRDSTMTNVYYLRDSGMYQYHNIVFGVTSVLGDRFVRSKDISSGAWRKIKQKNKYCIGLYHGAVHGSETDVGYRMNNRELLAQNFDGYDFVMLGDIHRFQFLNTAETIAYAGSLIQQSHGETIENHGYIQWDLIKGVGTHVSVPNDYCYCTIKLINGSCATKSADLNKIPKKPRIRFIFENTNQMQYREALTELEARFQIQEIITDTQITLFHPKDVVRKQNKKGLDLIDSSDQPEAIMSLYLNKQIPDESIKASIFKLHTEIYKNVCGTKTKKIHHHSIKNNKWKLIELRFSNTLSYGANNVIDFRKYQEHSVIGLFAPNFYGKSAVVDILLFCLFDRLSRGERRDILNTNKTRLSCSVLFSIGNKVYRIKRTGQKGNQTVKIDVDFNQIDPETHDIIDNLNGVDKNETNKNITNLIGDYNDYLTTCFYLQDQSHNFMDMTQLQKKEYLHHILKLNVFDSCHTYAKNHLKELTGQMKLLEQQLGRFTMDDLKTKIRETKTEIERLQRRKHHLANNLSAQFKNIVDMYKRTNLPVYTELSDYTLNSINDIVSTVIAVKSKIDMMAAIDLTELESAKAEAQEALNTHLQELEKNNIRQEIDTLTTKKDALTRKLVKVPNSHKTHRPLDTDKITKKINKASERLATVHKLIKTIQNEDPEGRLSSACDRIAELTNCIKQVRALIQPAPALADAINTLDDINQRRSITEKNVRLVMEKNQDTRHVLTPELRVRLEDRLKAYRLHAGHVQGYLDLINDHGEESELISQLRTRFENWLQNYEKWKQTITDNLSQESDPLTPILTESRNVRHKLTEAMHMYLVAQQNKQLTNQMESIQSELDMHAAFQGTKKELDNLTHEAELLAKQIDMDQEILEQHKLTLAASQTNEKIQIKIDAITNLITEHREADNAGREKTTKLRKALDTCRENVQKHKEQIKSHRKLTKHLQLLNKYYVDYVMWTQRTSNFDKWEKIKRDLDEKIAVVNTEIENKKIALRTYQDDLKRYLESRKEYDEKCTNVKLYQTYVQVMHQNGLPYEMLKVYLPIIEADVNQILHSMVSFNISFVFASSDPDRLEPRTKAQANNINIFICHEHCKPYNVLLGSGFEKFIIGLALRMTLSKISLTAKPNFFVIDEGWTCLDPDNLSNVETIINYIKSQYDHIILISHADDLKSQADHILNIRRDKGYSYLNNLQMLDVSTSSVSDTPRSSKTSQSSKLSRSKSKGNVLSDS